MSERPYVADEITAALTTASEREAFLRSKGASEERIRTQVKLPLARELAKLAARGLDVRAVLPPENETADDDQGLSERQWREVETLVDTAGKSYDEAIFIVKNR